MAAEAPKTKLEDQIREVRRTMAEEDEEEDGAASRELERVKKTAGTVENMLMHGWPKKVLDDMLAKQKLSDSNLHDLAGNSFVSGPICALLIAIFLRWPASTNVDKNQDLDAQNQEDEQILNLLG